MVSGSCRVLCSSLSSSTHQPTSMTDLAALITYMIFSNGRYKSVVHRATVNSMKSRLSVASLHSLNAYHNVTPSPILIDDLNPRLYRDTSYADFLDFLSSSDFKCKRFLESRKLH
ncbi:putative flavanone 3-dioxygenase [Helianthus annuus]|nr:putative flavanone 3-dioxygenase [Helianthus annuus]